VAPHQVKITPDGKYWGVVFYTGQTLQLYNTSDDKLAASINIGPGSWNTVSFTHDMTRAFAVDYLGSGVAEIDLTSFTSLGIHTGVANPHGSYILNGDSVLYLTAQFGNYIYRVKLPDYETDPVALFDAAHPAPLDSACNPHEFGFTPDESKYFVSCQSSSEVRILRTSDDKVDTVLNVGAFPQEFAVSKKHPYAFVTCQEDASTDPTQPGSVYVFNYETNQIITKIYTGKHPHGIAVDDDHDVVYVANKNDGGFSHHPASCGGTNGNITVIDMNTLQLLNVNLPDGSSYVYKTEVLPGPWYVSYRK
jgi:YVTN family beta-propeller protein